MKIIESHKHWYWCENRQCFPDEEFLIHLNEPRCFIRFDSKHAMLASYQEFYKSIAHIEWLDGQVPDDELKEQTLTEAWNFLAMEERILEGDLEDLEDE